MEVSGAYVVLWGGQEGIINSSLNAPGRQSASPPPIEFTAPRSGDILGFFLNFLILIQQKLMDKKIRYISCVSSVLHCLVNNVCGEKWL